MNRLHSALFFTGGVLMVAGAGCYAMLAMQDVACWVYLAGALLFATMQASETYDGRNDTIKRLKKIMNLADMLFVFAGLLMVENTYRLLLDSLSYATYIDMVYNKWVLLMLVAAMLETYTVHRISAELAKEEAAEKTHEDTPPTTDC